MANKDREILLVDDPVQTKLLGFHLTSNGLKVTEASHHRVGYHFISQDPAKFDVVVANLGPEQREGLEFALSVRRLTDEKKVPPLPIILVSSHELVCYPTLRLRVAQAISDNLIAEYMEKPLDFEKLIETIRNVRPSVASRQIETFLRGQRWPTD